MSDPLRARLTALVTNWRQPVDASVFGTEVAYAVYEEARQDCADQLAALLREPPEAVPSFTVCRYCGQHEPVDAARAAAPSEKSDA